MKILLIGHSIIDHFVELGDELSLPGGLYYSVIGILSAKKKTDEIFLLTSFNKKSFNLFEKVYSQTFFQFSNQLEEMPEVFLKTSGEGEREETYKNLSVQLSLANINDWNMFDGIIINMITGFDISIEQLKLIRKSYSGLIYFDVHTLARGIDKNMKRNFRPIPNIKEWLMNIDVIQCNENELRTIIQNENVNKCAGEILQCGPKILIVTKGDRGAQVFYQLNKDLISHEVKAEKVEVKNKVGCGDIFGAVFFYTYISTKDIYRSLIKGNKAGAIAVSNNNYQLIRKSN